MVQNFEFLISYFIDSPIFGTSWSKTSSAHFPYIIYVAGATVPPENGAAPPESELRGHSGGHFSTTGAPQTAERGVLDSPRGGASAMPIGVSVGALKGVVSILA